ncbi:hypothetical protein ACFP8W_23780, partial [Nocardioides hankookensis]
VAGEVKELATETARATERIEAVVAEVRTGTHDVLVTAEQIEAVFADVNTAQSTISTAAAAQLTAADSARVAIRGVVGTTQQVTDEVAQLAQFEG